MMVDNNQKRLNQAIHLSQHGEKQEARKILLQLIQENSKDEYAWLWLIDVCDSDRERKSVLSRGIKLNPESKLLQTAMKRFIDTGSLVPEGDSLDSLIIETKVDEIATTPKPKSNRQDSLAGDGSDLDWIGLEDESDREADTLDMISDDEFSRLSHEFFTTDDEQVEDFVFEDGVTLSESKIETSDSAQLSGSGLFLLDELLAEEEGQENSVADRSESNVELDEETGTKTSSDAIEDRLKGAFDAVEGGKKKQKRLNIRIPGLKTVSQKALIMLVSAFWLIIFVLGGMFLVHYFNLEQYFSLADSEEQLTPTEVVPEGVQETGMPEEEQENLVPTATPTPVPVQANVEKISRDTVSEIKPLETFTQPFSEIFNDEGEYTAVLELRTIQLIDVSGNTVWKQDMPAARAIGGGFSNDDSLLGIFSDDMKVKIWNVSNGDLEKELALSTDMQLIYSQIPYLPQDAKASVHFSVDHQYVAAAYWGGVTIWEMESGEVVHEYSLPQSILVNSFDGGTDLNFVMDFNPVTSQIAYGTRDNIYLVDVQTGATQQNWKTQYVGSVEWVSEDQILEIGYPLNQLSSYVSLWGINNLSPIVKENCLAASRGMHLPRYGHFKRTSILAFETEGTDSSRIAIKVISLIDGLLLSTIELETFQPILGIVDIANETIFAVWAQVPKEGFGVADSVQFWDVDTSELVWTCSDCTFLSGILADQYGLFINEAGTLITQYAEGIGSQQLGIPVE